MPNPGNIKIKRLTLVLLACLSAPSFAATATPTPPPANAKPPAPSGKATPVPKPPTVSGPKGKSVEDLGLPASSDWNKVVSLEVGLSGLPFDTALSTLVRAIGYTPVIKDVPKSIVTTKFKALPFSQIVPLLMGLNAPEVKLTLLENKVILIQGKALTQNPSVVAGQGIVPPAPSEPAAVVKTESRTFTVATSADYTEIIALLGGRATRSGKSYVVIGTPGNLDLIVRTINELENANLVVRELRTLTLERGERAEVYLAALRNLFPEASFEAVNNKVVVYAPPSRISVIQITLESLRSESGAQAAPTPTPSTEPAPKSAADEQGVPPAPSVLEDKALRYYGVGARAGDFATAVKTFFPTLPISVTAGQLIVEASDDQASQIDDLVAKLLESSPNVTPVEVSREQPTLKTYPLGTHALEYARLITTFFAAKAEVGGDLLVVQALPAIQVQIEGFLKEVPKPAEVAPTSATPSAPAKSERVSVTFPILGPGVEVESAVKSAFPELSFTRLSTLGSFVASGTASELAALGELLGKINLKVPLPVTATQAFTLKGNGSGLLEALSKFVPTAVVSLQGPNLLVEGTPSELSKVSSIVTALDRAPEPVAKLPDPSPKTQLSLPLSNAKAEALSVQLKALFPELSLIADARTNEIIFSGTELQLAGLKEVVAQLDKPVAQAALRVQITQIDVTAAESLGLDWKAITGGLGLSTLKSLASGDLSKLDVTLSALAQSGKSKTLTDSSFLVTSGKMTQLISGGSVLLPKTNTSSSNTSVSGYESSNYGLDIVLEPQVGADGSITLDVKTSLGRAPIAGAGGSLQFPAQSFQSQIRFKSGDSVVFGGVVGSTTTESNTGIPVLKDLPIIGGLFGTTTKTRSTQALLIVIRGRTAPDSSQANLDFADKIDKVKAQDKP